jgi:hypothetical protein
VVENSDGKQGTLVCGGWETIALADNENESAAHEEDEVRNHATSDDQYHMSE